MTPRLASVVLGLVAAGTLGGCADLAKKLVKKDETADAGAAVSVAQGNEAPTGTTRSILEELRGAASATPGTGATGGARATSRSTATAAPTAAAPTASASAATDTPPSPAQLETAFAQLDINGDKQLDGIEVTTCGCASADRDGNKEISKAEYLAAGLLGKLPRSAVSPAPAKPGTAPPPAQPAQPAQPTQPAQPPPTGAGLPPGSYSCYGTVGTFYGLRGILVIKDASHYAHGSDGSGGGTYVFDPATKKIRFTSGLFADPEKCREAHQVSAVEIQMRTGKDGFYTWDCKR